MKIVAVPGLKIVIPFKAGCLPRVDPNDPRFVLALGSLKIAVRLNPKTARKLNAHTGSAGLQGKLIQTDDGQFVLAEAGFQFWDLQPTHPVEASGNPTEVKVEAST